MSEIIENLYEAFSDIPQRRKVAGCTFCCIKEWELEELTKDRKIVSKDIISILAHNSMATVGNADDFQYFFPRICEEMLNDDFFWSFGADAFLNRIHEAGFDSWNSAKQKTTQEFIKALLSKFISDDDLFESAHWIAAAIKTNSSLKPFFDVMDLEKNKDFKARFIDEYIVRPELKWDDKNIVLFNIYEVTQDQFLPLELWAYD